MNIQPCPGPAPLFAQAGGVWARVHLDGERTGQRQVDGTCLRTPAGAAPGTPGTPRLGGRSGGVGGAGTWTGRLRWGAGRGNPRRQPGITARPWFGNGSRPVLARGGGRQGHGTGGGRHSKPAQGATSRLPWGGGPSLVVLVPSPRLPKAMPEAPPGRRPAGVGHGRAAGGHRAALASGMGLGRWESPPCLLPGKQSAPPLGSCLPCPCPGAMLGTGAFPDCQSLPGRGWGPTSAPAQPCRQGWARGKPRSPGVQWVVAPPAGTLAPPQLPPASQFLFLFAYWAPSLSRYTQLIRQLLVVPAPGLGNAHVTPASPPGTCGVLLPWAPQPHSLPRCLP